MLRPALLLALLSVAVVATEPRCEVLVLGSEFPRLLYLVGTGLAKGRLHPEGQPTTFLIPVSPLVHGALDVWNQGGVNATEFVVDMDLEVPLASLPVQVVDLYDAQGNKFAQASSANGTQLRLTQLNGKAQNTVKRAHTTMELLTPTFPTTIGFIAMSVAVPEGQSLAPWQRPVGDLPDHLAFTLWSLTLRRGCPKCYHSPFGFQNSAGAVPLFPTDQDADGPTAMVSTTTVLPSLSSRIAFLDMAALVNPRTHMIDAPGAHLLLDLTLPSGTDSDTRHRLTVFRVVSDTGLLLYGEAPVALDAQHAPGGGPLTLRVPLLSEHHHAVDPALWRRARVEVDREGPAGVMGVPSLVSAAIVVPAGQAAPAGLGSEPVETPADGHPRALYPLAGDAVHLTYGNATAPLLAPAWDLLPWLHTDPHDVNVAFEVLYSEEVRRCPIEAVNFLLHNGTVATSMEVHEHPQWGLDYARAGLSFTCPPTPELLRHATKVQFVLRPSCAEDAVVGPPPASAGFSVRAFAVGLPFDPIDHAERCGAAFDKQEFDSPFKAPTREEFWYCVDCCCKYRDIKCPGKEWGRPYCLPENGNLAEVMACDAPPVNEQCQFCSLSNPNIQTPAANGTAVACNDHTQCTQNDTCVGLLCAGELYDEAAVCLADATVGPACEECDGQGGCQTRPGHFVYPPGVNASENLLPNRTCACRINGTVHPHGTISPFSPCQRCDVYSSSTQWTWRSNGVQCDPVREAVWWENTLDQACRYDYTCLDGVCQQGVPYVCPAVPGCGAINATLGRQCDHQGPADPGTAGCVLHPLPASTPCRPAVHGCMAEVTCRGNGSLSCPEYDPLPGLMYLTNRTAVHVVHPDGTLADPRRPFVPSASHVAAEFDSFAVQCDELAMEWGVIPDGECRIRRAGAAWGVRHVVDEGHAVLLAPQLQLQPVAGSMLMAPADAASAAVAVHLTDLSAFVDPQCDCIRRGTLSFEVRHAIPDYPLAAAHLVDGAGRTLGGATVLEIQQAAVGAWATATVYLPSPVPAADFNWRNVSGVRFTRGGLEAPVPVDLPVLRVDVRNIAVQKQWDAPCPVLHLLPAVDAVLQGYPSGATSAVATLPAPVDLSPAVAALDHAVLAFDLRVTDETVLPAVLLLYAAEDGREGAVRVPLPAPATGSPAAHFTTWTSVRVPLHSRLVNRAILHLLHLDACDTVEALFDTRLPPPRTPPFIMRGLRVVHPGADGAGACGMHAVLPGGRDSTLFDSGVDADAVDMVATLRQDGIAEAVYTPAGLSSPTFAFTADLRGAHLDFAQFWLPGGCGCLDVPDPTSVPDCGCLHGAELVLRVAMADAAVADELVAIAIVTGDERGLRIPLSEWVVGRGAAVQAAGLDSPVTVRLRVQEHHRHPDPNIDLEDYQSMAFLRLETTATAAARRSTLQLLSVAVEHVELPCHDDTDAVTGAGAGAAETLRLLPNVVHRFHVWPDTDRLAANRYPADTSTHASVTDVAFDAAEPGPASYAGAAVLPDGRIAAVGTAAGALSVLDPHQPCDTAFFSLSTPSGTLQWASPVVLEPTSAVAAGTVTLSDVRTAADGSSVVALAGRAEVSSAAAMQLCLADGCADAGIVRQGVVHFVAVVDVDHAGGALLFARADGVPEGTPPPAAASVFGGTVAWASGAADAVAIPFGAAPLLPSSVSIGPGGCHPDVPVASTVVDIAVVDASLEGVAQVSVSGAGQCASSGVPLPAATSSDPLVCAVRYCLTSGAARWFHCVPAPSAGSGARLWAGPAPLIALPGRTPAGAAAAVWSWPASLSAELAQLPGAPLVAAAATLLAVHADSGQALWWNAVEGAQNGSFTAVAVSSHSVLGLVQFTTGSLAVVGPSAEPPLVLVRPVGLDATVPVLVEMNRTTGVASHMSQLLSDPDNGRVVTAAAIAAAVTSPHAVLAGATSTDLQSTDGARRFSAPVAPDAPGEATVGYLAHVSISPRSGLPRRAQRPLAAAWVAPSVPDGLQNANTATVAAASPSVGTTVLIPEGSTSGTFVSPMGDTTRVPVPFAVATAAVWPARGVFLLGGVNSDNGPWAMLAAVDHGSGAVLRTNNAVSARRGVSRLVSEALTAVVGTDHGPDGMPLVVAAVQLTTVPCRAGFAVSLPVPTYAGSLDQSTLQCDRSYTVLRALPFPKLSSVSFTSWLTASAGVTVAVSSLTADEAGARVAAGINLGGAAGTVTLQTGTMTGRAVDTVSLAHAPPPPASSFSSSSAVALYTTAMRLVWVTPPVPGLRVDRVAWTPSGLAACGAAPGVNASVWVAAFYSTGTVAWRSWIGAAASPDPATCVGITAVEGVITVAVNMPTAAGGAAAGVPVAWPTGTSTLLPSAAPAAAVVVALHAGSGAPVHASSISASADGVLNPASSADAVRLELLAAAPAAGGGLDLVAVATGAVSYAADGDATGALPTAVLDARTGPQLAGLRLAASELLLTRPILRGVRVAAGGGGTSVARATAVGNQLLLVAGQYNGTLALPHGSEVLPSRPEPTSFVALLRRQTAATVEAVVVDDAELAAASAVLGTDTFVAVGHAAPQSGAAVIAVVSPREGDGYPVLTSHPVSGVPDLTLHAVVADTIHRAVVAGHSSAAPSGVTVVEGPLEAGDGVPRCVVAEVDTSNGSITAGAVFGRGNCSLTAIGLADDGDAVVGGAADGVAFAARLRRAADAWTLEWSTTLPAGHVVHGVAVTAAAVVLCGEMPATNSTAAATVTGFVAALQPADGAMVWQYAPDVPAAVSHSAAAVAVAALPGINTVAVAWSAPSGTVFPPLASAAAALTSPQRRGVLVTHDVATGDAVEAHSIGGPASTTSDVLDVSVGSDGEVAVAGAFLPHRRVGFTPQSISAAAEAVAVTPPSQGLPLLRQPTSMVVAQLRPRYGLVSSAPSAVLAAPDTAPCDHVTPLGTALVVCATHSPASEAVPARSPPERATGPTTTIRATSTAHAWTQWAHSVHSAAGPIPVTAVAAHPDDRLVYVALQLTAATAPSASASFPWPAAGLIPVHSTVVVAFYADGSAAWAQQLHPHWPERMLTVTAMTSAATHLVLAGSSSGVPTLASSPELVLDTAAARATVPAPRRCFALVVAHDTGAGRGGLTLGSASPGAECHAHHVAWVSGVAAAPAVYLVGSATVPDATATDSAPPVSEDPLLARRDNVGWLARVVDVGTASPRVLWDTYVNGGPTGEGPPLGAFRHVATADNSDADNDAPDVLVLADAAGTVPGGCVLMRLADSVSAADDAYRTERLPLVWELRLEGEGQGAGGAPVACDDFAMAWDGRQLLVPVAAASASVVGVRAGGTSGPSATFVGRKPVGLPAITADHGAGAALFVVDTVSGVATDSLVLASRGSGVRLGSRAAATLTSPAALVLSVAGDGLTAHQAATAATDFAPALRLTPHASSPLSGLARFLLPPPPPLPPASIAREELPPTQTDLREALDPAALVHVVSEYHLQMDVRLHSPAYRVLGGRFQHQDGSGAGFSFHFNPVEVFAAPLHQWVTLRAAVTANNTLDALALRDQWRHLHSFVLTRSGPLAAGEGVNPREFVDVRRVLLVGDHATCSAGCGVQSLLPDTHTFATPWLGVEELPPPWLLPGLRLLAAADLPLDFAVSLGRLVDQPCNCLAGVTVSLGLGGAGCQPQALVLTSDPALLSAAVIPLQPPAGDGAVRTTVAWEHHVGDLLAVDWSRVSQVLVAVPDDGTCDAGVHVQLSDLTATRPCVRPDQVFAPTSAEGAVEVPTFRSSRRLDDGQTLTHNGAYKLIARGVNVWGRRSQPTCSQAFTVDLTPPDLSPLLVLDLVPRLDWPRATDAMFSPNDTVLRVGWVGTVGEPESGPLLTYSVADVVFAGNGSSAGLTVAAAPSKLLSAAVGSTPDEVSGAFVDVKVQGAQQGVPYRVVLGVENGARSVSVAPSSGVVLDWTPPVVLDHPPRLLEGRPEPGGAPTVVTASATGVDMAVEWSIHDPHTPIREVRWGWGTTPGGADLVEFVTIPDATASGLPSVSLPVSAVTGTPYYFLVWAANSANVSTVHASAPFVKDPSRPVVDYVVGVSPAASDVADDPLSLTLHWFTPSAEGAISEHAGTGLFKAKWRCTDVDSVERDGQVLGTMAYRWRLCAGVDATCAEELMGWTAAAADTRGTSPGVIQAGHVSHMVVQVQCTNPAGLATVDTSSPIAVAPGTEPLAHDAFVLDVAPPCSAGCTDINYTANATLAVAWGGFTLATPTDPPIVAYIVDLVVGGTVWSRTTVASDVFRATMAVEPDAAHGRQWHWRVTAASNLGQAVARSDGVVVDLTDPVVHALHAEFVACRVPECAVRLPPLGAPVVAVAHGDPMRVAFNLSDPEAPLVACTWGLGACSLAQPATDRALALSSPTPHAVDTFVEVSPSPAPPPSVWHCPAVRCTTAAGRTVAVAAVPPVSRLDVVRPLSPGALVRPVMVDTTPPVVAPTVRFGSHPSASTLYTANTTVAVQWTCADNDTAVLRVEVEVAVVRVAPDGLYVATDVAHRGVVHTPAQSNGALMAPNVTRTYYSDGTPAHYVATVTCVSMASLASSGSTPPLRYDGTPPDATLAAVGLLDGTHHVHALAHGWAWPTTASLSVTWHGFEDPDTVIAGYSVAVGTSRFADDVWQLSDVGSTTAVTLPGLHLSDGDTVYITVQARNRAGAVTAAVSRDVVVDASAPAAGNVTVVGATAGWVTDGARVEVAFPGLRDPDGNATTRYAAAVGVTPYSGQRSDFGGVMELPRAAMNLSVDLSVGAQYWATVWAVNDVGMSTVAVSSPFRYDPYPPVVTGVRVGAGGMALAATDDPEAATHCSVDVVDALSPVTAVQFELLVVQSGREAVVVAANVTAVPAAQQQPQTLQHQFSLAAGAASVVGQRRAACRATALDASGLASEPVASALVPVDSTPPVAGAAWDGTVPGTNRDAQEDRTVVDVAWDPTQWRDDESGVSRMLWAVGTQAGLADVVPWRAVVFEAGTASAALASPLSPGQVYSSTLVAYNALQQASTPAWSAGFVVSDVTATAVTAAVAYLPAESTPSRGSCHCRGSAARFDAVRRVCLCPPQHYLAGPAVGQVACAECPAGTCKPGWGNDPAACVPLSGGQGVCPEETAPADGNHTALTACDAADPLKVLGADGVTCGCGPGAVMAAGRGVSSAACSLCPGGTFKPGVDAGALPSACMPCAPSAQDSAAALVVAWVTEAPVPVQLDSVRLTVAPVNGTTTSTWSTELPAVSPLVTLNSLQRGSAQVYAPWVFGRGAQVVVTVAGIASGAALFTGSTAVTVDFTAPIVGEVVDGPGPGDAGFTTDSTSLTVTLQGWRDPESGLAEVEVGFGMAPGSVNLTGGWVSAPLAVAQSGSGTVVWSLPAGSAVASGATVYAAVRARNGAGALSAVAVTDGIVVEPHIAQGTVGLHLEYPAQSPPWPTATVMWQFDVSHVSAYTYTWAVQRVAGGAVLANGTAGGTHWAAVAVDLPAADGDVLQARVTAHNPAGATADVYSVEVQVNPSAPDNGTMAWVAPGAVLGDVVYAPSLADVRLAWEFVDDEGPVRTVHVVVGGVAFGADTWTTVVSAATGGVATGDLALAPAVADGVINGRCLRATAMAVNGAGFASATAAVSVPLCLDASLPVVAVDTVVLVADTEAVELSGGGKMAQAAAVMVGAPPLAVWVSGSVWDAESGVPNATIQLQSSEGAAWTVPVPDAAVDADTGAFNVSVTPTVAANVTTETRVWVSVAAVNGAGAVAQSETAGPPFVLVSAAPNVSFVDIPAVAPPGTNVTAAWATGGLSQDVSIGRVSLVVVDLSSGDVLADRAWGSGTVTQAQVHVPSATSDGAVLFCVLRVCTAPTVCAGVEHKVTVDSTPPTYRLQQQFAVHLDDQQLASSDWVAVSQVAGLRLTLPTLMERSGPVAGVAVTVGTSASGAQLSQGLHHVPIPVASSLSNLEVPTLGDALRDGAAALLWHGAPLYVTLIAWNQAGLPLTLTRQLATVAAEAPVAGSRPDAVFFGADASVVWLAVDGQPSSLPPPSATAAAVRWPAGPLGSVAVAPHGGPVSVTVWWLPFDAVLAPTEVTVELTAHNVTGDSGPGELVAWAAVPDTTATRARLSGVWLPPGQAVRARLVAVDAGGTTGVTPSGNTLLVTAEAGPVLEAGGLPVDGLAPPADLDCLPSWTAVAEEEEAYLLVSLAYVQSVTLRWWDSVPPTRALWDLLLRHYDDPAALPGYTVVTASWGAWVHSAGDRVAAVEVAVGTVGSGADDDVAAWYPVPGDVRAVQVVVPRQLPGAHVRVSVRAVTVTGLVSEVVASDGARVVCTPGVDDRCQFEGYFVCV